MDSVGGETSARARRRRRLTAAVKLALRDLRGQLALLNHRVGAHLDLRDGDLDCLDLIARHGPLTPSTLARRAGLHPATMTGILDRLEGGGWISRDRDPSDRRAVVIRARHERNAEVFGLYAEMNALMDQICAGYDDAALEVVADFLRRATDAGRTAGDSLARD